MRVSVRVSVRALLPLGGGKVSGTLGAVPGAVRVPGQAALGAGLPVHLAAVQGHLRDAQSRAQVQLLLQTQKTRRKLYSPAWKVAVGGFGLR